MMTHANNTMMPWMGGGMWVGIVMGVLVVGLLIFVAMKISRK